MLISPEEPTVAGPPVTIEPALLETSAVGALPRIAADGDTSLRHYARPFLSSCARPCVGVVVTGLGLAGAVSTRALALPAAVGLSFSPYADAADWQARARRSGHEALLDLPLQPAAFPRDDSGPLTVRTTAPPPPDEAVARVLAAGRGYVALAAEAGAFAAEPQAFAPIAHALQQRGLGFVEVGGTTLSAAARAEGLAFGAAQGPIDEGFEVVEIEAKREGRALLVVEPTPAGLDGLEAWLVSLPGKRLRLAPPSRLLAADDAPQTAATP
jgi:polysaccharide deacetylase 2 family uncharacterized protein YibQ